MATVAVPDDRRYRETDEWALETASGTVRIGLSAHAADELGDVAYVDLPEPGTAVRAGESFGVVESAKAVSELYAPVSGRVEAVNRAVEREPRTVNRDPYGEGWLLEVSLETGGNGDGDPGTDAESLLEAAAYRELIE
jgi:glycine cleavage system H protein